MNSKTIGILTAIIIVSIAIINLSGGSKDSADSLVGSAVFPDLKNMLDEVRQVDIVTRESEVSLALIDNLWVVKNRDDYPASFDMLSDLLDNLTEAKFAEKKTSKAEYFDRLGLRDLDQQDSQSIKVKIVTAAEESMQLLVGNAATNRDGQFFRFPGELQTWMMSTELDVETDAEDWLKPTILNIDSERVKKVTQTSASGEKLTVVREGSEEENFDIVDLPAGKKLRYGTIANELGRSLVNVRLKDVKKIDGFDFDGGGKAEYWCKDGLVVNVLTKEMDGRYYLGFSVEAGEVGEKKVEEEDSADGQELDSEQEPDQVTLAEEVTKLKKDLDAWVFEVTQFTFDDFTKTMDDLVEEEQEPVIITED